MAGFALLTAVPLFTTSAAFLSGRPARWGSVPTAAAIAETIASDLAGAELVPAPTPTVSITIEPPSLAIPAEPEPPVVFPGYLLPDESAEEAPHAGS